MAGQFVGEFTLAECARRNGVATDALDVGIDETGALAAAPTAAFAPPPSAPMRSTTRSRAGAATSAPQIAFTLRITFSSSQSHHRSDCSLPIV